MIDGLRRVDLELAGHGCLVPFRRGYVGSGHNARVFSQVPSVPQTEHPWYVSATVKTNPRAARAGVVYRKRFGEDRVNRQHVQSVVRQSVPQRCPAYG